MTGADTRPEASLVMVVQPRCARCETPHPATLGLSGDACPNCGEASAPLRSIEVTDIRIASHG